MSGEAKLREQICLLATSIFDRGLTGGSTGNISARTDDGGLLVSPTGTSFGRLDPARLSRFDAEGQHVDGDAPTVGRSIIGMCSRISARLDTMRRLVRSTNPRTATPMPVLAG